MGESYEQHTFLPILNYSEDYRFSIFISIVENTGFLKFFPHFWPKNADFKKFFKIAFDEGIDYR
jgi:hypothetical protein